MVLNKKYESGKQYNIVLTNKSSSIGKFDRFLFPTFLSFFS